MTCDVEPQARDYWEGTNERRQGGEDCPQWHLAGRLCYLTSHIWGSKYKNHSLKKKKKSKHEKVVHWWGEREEKVFVCLFLIFLKFDANPLWWGGELCVIFITEE